MGFVLCGFPFGFQDFWVHGLGFALCGFLFRFQGFWVRGLGFVLCGLGFKVEGCEFGFTGTLLVVLTFSFWFYVCYFAWCLVFGDLVVRKRGKAKGFSGFVNILWVSRFVNFFFLCLLS